MGFRTEHYSRRGLLAIAPSALFEAFLVMDDAARDNTAAGDAVIVDVRGPLEQHAHPFFDSYEAITQRVAAACETTARTVVLRFDSPGGEVAGCFDTAPALRAMCDAAGKRLVAYVEGNCCSAAYALASQCERIVLGVTALCGSIGVLSCREDVTAANAARGVRVELITSGQRKADGHPAAPVSEAELQNAQLIVNSMAQVFFDLVASGRGMKPEAVAQLQAAVFHGSAAVAAGLADAVGPLAMALAADAASTTGDANMSAYEKAVAALTEAAEGSDANAAAAKKALAALQAAGGEPDGDEEKKDAPAAEGDQEPPKAEGDAAPAQEPDGDEPKATAAFRMAVKAEQRVAQLQAELQVRDERDERRNLLDSRPDLSPEMKAVLQKAPIALVRETIAGLPATRVPGAARAAGATPLRGHDQGAGGASGLPANEKAELDARMGLSSHQLAARNSEYRLELGVAQPQGSKH